MYGEDLAVTFAACRATGPFKRSKLKTYDLFARTVEETIMTSVPLGVLVQIAEETNIEFESEIKSEEFAVTEPSSPAIVTMLLHEAKSGTELSSVTVMVFTSQGWYELCRTIVFKLA